MDVLLVTEDADMFVKNKIAAVVEVWRGSYLKRYRIVLTKPHTKFQRWLFVKKLEVFIAYIQVKEFFTLS